MLSENEELPMLGGKKPLAGSAAKAVKMGLAADASDDEDMFADICVDDLDEEPAAALAAATAAEDAPEKEAEAADAAPAAMAAAEDRGAGAGQEPAGAAVQMPPQRPPRHPANFTAALVQAALPLADDDGGEGKQDSCSAGSTASGEQQEELAQWRERQHQEGGGPSNTGNDSASLADDPAPAASPVAAAAAESPAKGAADEPGLAGATLAPGIASVQQEEEVAAAEVAAEGVYADPEVDAEPQAAVLAVEEAGGKMEALVVEHELAGLQVLREVQFMDAEAVPSAAVSPKPAVAPAPAAPEQMAAAPPAVPKPTPAPPPAAPKLAAAPASRPPATCPAMLAGIPPLFADAAKPAILSAKPAAAVPLGAPKPTAAAALLSLAAGKLAVPPAATKFSLPAAGPAGGSLNPLLGKAGVLQFGGNAFNASSRLGLQLAGSSSGALPNKGLGLMGGQRQVAPPPGTKPKAATISTLPAKQQPAPALRQPAPAALYRQPAAAAAAGTPGPSLPKHMQAAAAAGVHKVSTPAPFTPGSDAPAAAPQQKQQQAAQQESPRVSPATLADDILAVDFGHSAVLEGHEACMEESLALCVPIQDAVQEQMLALDQLNLEAEALQRQINSLRVDVTIYRSSLAFMDSPLQAHAFEACKRKATELSAGLASYQPPTFAALPAEEPLQQRLEPTEAEPEQDAGDNEAAAAGASEEVSAGSPATAETASLMRGTVGGSEEESPMEPRALESVFDRQPLASSSLAEPAGPAAGAAARSCVPPTQEEVGAAATAAAGAAPMQAEGPAVSVVLSAHKEGVVLSLAV